MLEATEAARTPADLDDLVSARRIASVVVESDSCVPGKLPIEPDEIMDVRFVLHNVAGKRTDRACRDHSDPIGVRGGIRPASDARAYSHRRPNRRKRSGVAYPAGSPSAERPGLTAMVALKREDLVRRVESRMPASEVGHSEAGTGRDALTAQPGRECSICVELRVLGSAHQEPSASPGAALRSRDVARVFVPRRCG